MKEKVFKLMQNCIPVKGVTRSLICDLQRNVFDIIPNDLYDILIAFEGKTKNEVKVAFENGHDNTIDEYFDFLVEKEYIFFTDTPDWFPELNMQFDYPFEFSNGIIDISSDSEYNLYSALEQYDGINCKFIELRFFHSINLDLVQNIISFLDEMESMITSIGFALPYNAHITEEALKELLEKFPRISYIVIWGAIHQKFIEPIREKSGYLIFTEVQLKDETCCGVIHPSFFVTNIKNFTEALSYNSCLNRKISVDSLGNIKNCPSMSQSYGNIENTTLKDVSKIKAFKKYWNITKDDIKVCKDCEFRYICTDCRAYKENPKDDYSKPLKCGYNPYTSEWTEWSSNPLKLKAIEYYGMHDLVKCND
jgi:SPASM domain peptide maturase of grasp-with-spasm system